jgi:putative membrane protein insertion efficiency factor
MKKIVILLIDGYQKFLSGAILNILGVPHACRFNPTCSQYAKKIISEKGIFVGGYLSFSRILKCQPFNRGATSV